MMFIQTEAIFLIVVSLLFRGTVAATSCADVLTGVGVWGHEGSVGFDMRSRTSGDLYWVGCVGSEPGCEFTCTDGDGFIEFGTNDDTVPLRMMIDPKQELNDVFVTDPGGCGNDDKPYGMLAAGRHTGFHLCRALHYSTFEPMLTIKTEGCPVADANAPNNFYSLFLDPTENGDDLVIQKYRCSEPNAGGTNTGSGGFGDGQGETATDCGFFCQAIRFIKYLLCKITFGLVCFDYSL